MLHGVTNADRFFPWVSEYLKLTSLLFSVNFFQKIFLKKRSTCFSLRWIWFRCLSLSMTSIFFAFFCPWNSFPGFLFEQLFPWRKSYMKKLISMGFQSINTFFLWTLQRFSYKNRQRKIVIRRTYQQRFFHERFSKVDCELGSFQMISIFNALWSLTKTSEGCLWMKLVDFLSEKTSFLALHFYEIGSSGVPVSEMVLVLVSPWMKAVFMESIPVE